MRHGVERRPAVCLWQRQRHDDVGSGALGYVFNGGSASNLAIIGSGAIEQINVGGILVGGSVLSGALEYILGSGSNILVSGTGALMQLYGATTSITVGSGGIEVVNSGTVDSAALITLGGDQIVIATATAISATVATSGRQDVWGRPAPRWCRG